jgi:hypothetical protein
MTINKFTFSYGRRNKLINLPFMQVAEEKLIDKKYPASASFYYSASGIKLQQLPF